MSRRKLPAMSTGERAALVAGLRALAEHERRATLDKYVMVANAYDAGMTVLEIATLFDVSGNTAHRWKDAGTLERERRAANPDA